MLIVNSPGNPSGKVFTRRELEGIAEIACRHDLMVITDEIYEYFVFDGREHLSVASFPSMSGRTITIGGYSKTFSITGWRIGYSVAEAKWAKAIGAMSDVCTSAHRRRFSTEWLRAYETLLRRSMPVSRRNINRNGIVSVRHWEKRAYLPVSRKGRIMCLQM